MSFIRLSLQDVDSAYMSKVELQAKVEALDKETKFFKCLYEGVRPSCSPFPSPSPAPGWPLAMSSDLFVIHVGSPGTTIT